MDFLFSVRANATPSHTRSAHARDAKHSRIILNAGSVQRTESEPSATNSKDISLARVVESSTSRVRTQAPSTMAQAGPTEPPEVQGLSLYKSSS